MRGKTLVLLVAVAAVAFVIGRNAGRPSAPSPSLRGPAGAEAISQPAKPIEPPTPDDLKVWIRHHELLLQSRPELPDPKEMEKLSDEAKLALRKVQEFIAVITPRFYKLQEQEVARLQAAGAFSDASLPLIREEALKTLAQEFPSMDEAALRRLLSIPEETQAG